MEPVSLKELSRLSGIPETNVRRYTENFPLHFPCKMVGRNKFYPDSLVPLVQLIAKRYQDKVLTEFIKEELERDYPPVIDMELEPPRHSAAPEMGLSTEVFGQMMQMVAQQGEILRQMVQALDQSKEVGELRRREVERDRKLDEVLRKLNEKKGLVRKFKEFLFGRD